MNPKTTADVVSAVEKAFTPDITIRRLKGSLYYRTEYLWHRALFRDICITAYDARKAEADCPSGRPLYAVDEIGKKLWDGKIDDEVLDRFLFAAGSYGFVVEHIDERNPDVG